MRSTECSSSFIWHCPLTSTWPHLRCDVGLEEGRYLQNCLCATIKDTRYHYFYRYNGAQWYEHSLQAGRSSFNLAWFNSVFRVPLYLRSSWCYVYLFFVAFFILPFSELSLHGGIGPLTFLTNRCPSVLWNGWLKQRTVWLVSTAFYITSWGKRLRIFSRYFFTIETDPWPIRWYKYRVAQKKWTIMQSVNILRKLLLNNDFILVECTYQRWDPETIKK